MDCEVEPVVHLFFLYWKGMNGHFKSVGEWNIIRSKTTFNLNLYGRVNYYQDTERGWVFISDYARPLTLYCKN